MLRMWGGAKRLCDGVTRRDLLTAGSLSLCGLGMPALAQAMGATEPSSLKKPAKSAGFGSAKNVILLYLFGGPSQLDTLDMKPNAPAEIRGDFKTISSTLPGLQICEHLPAMAQLMDRTTVVRSLSHPWNFHGMQYATTGLPVGSIPVEETAIHEQHQPFLGSVVHYHDQLRQGSKPHGAVPDNIMLPFPLSSRRPAAHYAKPYSA
ncbi:MAG: hypothetical protein JWM11_6064, partial [Planctomycetaceae bacterium]|nr:hypothetical protein [Planctomycetaceae bacterium]